MKELNKVLRLLSRIETKIDKNNGSVNLEDFISEVEAKKLFTRGTTWFWTLRQQGLPYTKMGGQVYYKRSDLYAYLDSNMKGGENG